MFTIVTGRYNNETWEASLVTERKKILLVYMLLQLNYRKKLTQILQYLLLK